MRWIGSLALGALVLGGSYFLYQRPEIRELFQTSESNGNPLHFLENLPELSPKVETERSTNRRTKRIVGSGAVAASAAEVPEVESESAPEYSNQVPNEELRKVLMQIFAAKKVAHSISLSVTDSKVIVAGEVESGKERRQILDLIERGREAREIDATHLMIRN